MRFRRSEGIPIPRKEKKSVGRPVGWRKEDRVVTTMRVSENLKTIVDIEHKPGERACDTVERMLYERAQTIQALRKEIDSLQSQVENSLRHQGTI